MQLEEAAEVYLVAPIQECMEVQERAVGVELPALQEQMAAVLSEVLDMVVEQVVLVEPFLQERVAP